MLSRSSLAKPLAKWMDGTVVVQFAAKPARMIAETKMNICSLWVRVFSSSIG